LSKVLNDRPQTLYTEVNAFYLGGPDTEFINMDQTAVQFEMPPNSTIEFVGQTSVCISSEGNTTSRIMVALAITSTGRKLPPYLIYKAAERGRVVCEFANPQLNYPTTDVYSVQSSAWIDEAKMLDWIER
jgi:hypothetical protein